MKKFIIALALTAVAASPVFAKSRAARAVSDQGYGAYAAAYPEGTGLVVSGDSQTIGADPDPAVRLSIRRDAPTGSSQ